MSDIIQYNPTDASESVNNLHGDVASRFNGAVDVCGLEPHELNDLEKVYAALRVATEQGRLAGHANFLSDQITELRRIKGNNDIRAGSLIPEFKMYTDPITGMQVKLNLKDLGVHKVIDGMVDFTSGTRVYVAGYGKHMPPHYDHLISVPEYDLFYGAIALHINQAPDAVFKPREQSVSEDTNADIIVPPNHVNNNFSIPEAQAETIQRGVEYIQSLLSYGPTQPFILDTIPLVSISFQNNQKNEIEEQKTNPTERNKVLVPLNTIEDPIIEKLAGVDSGFRREYNKHHVSSLLGGQYKRAKAMGVADLACRHILMNDIFSEDENIGVGILMRDDNGFSHIDPNYPIGTPFYKIGHDTVDIVLFRRDPELNQLIGLFNYRVTHTGAIDKFSYYGGYREDAELEKLREKLHKSIEEFKNIFTQITPEGPKQISPSTGGGSMPFMRSPLFRYMFK